MRVHDIEDLLRNYDKVFLITESRYIKMWEEEAGDAGKVIVLLPISGNWQQYNDLSRISCLFFPHLYVSALCYQKNFVIITQ